MQAWYSLPQAPPWLEALLMLIARMAATAAGTNAIAFIDVTSLCPLKRRITS